MDINCENPGASDIPAIVDIDSELIDPLVWSSYAPDIYNITRVREVGDVIMWFILVCC